MDNGNMWQSAEANTLAKIISSLPGLYCGPASVGWIAAVWNAQRGRSYDFKKRLADKKLFPDGPRPFHVHIPGFQLALSDLLKRETKEELALSPHTYFRHEVISNLFLRDSLPVIIRIPGSSLRHGLHYVTAFRSETRTLSNHSEVRFAWQDNGLYASQESIGPGLSNSPWKRVGTGIFPWGAKQVVVL